MTSDELKRALDELGWRGSDLADRVAAHRNSVSRWLTGQVSVPGGVAAYVRLALKVKRLDV